MNKKSLLIISAILLLGLAVTVFIFFSLRSKRSNEIEKANDNIAEGSESSDDTGENIYENSENMDSSDEIYTEEEEQIVINFSDSQLVFKGYPLISKDYVKIFRFVYLGMGSDEESFVEEETSVDQQGSYSYKLSNDKNRIYTGVGRDLNNKPIKQAIEIFNVDDLSEISKDCQTNNEDINGLSAKSIGCTDYTSVACWVPVDDEKAILYTQESQEKISDSDMCENLKKNGIFEISFLAY